jgi:hypothetical protein
MKKILLITISFIILFSAAASADYNSDMNYGLAAFKQNNLLLSFRYYYRAYKQNPSPKLLNVLKYLREKLRAQSAAEKQPLALKQDGGFPWKWALIGADAASIAATIALDISYNNEADKYDSMYKTMNNTTEDNYNKLKAENDVFNSRQGAFVTGVVITLILAGYTTADLLWLHKAFPVETAVVYNPGNGAVSLAFGYNF